MHAAATHTLSSYRCRIRQHNRPPADDPALDAAITIKATDAVAAMRLAGIVTGCAVIDAERQDAVIGGAA